MFRQNNNNDDSNGQNDHSNEQGVLPELTMGDYYNEGVVYQVENYRFRFRGRHAAEIELLILDKGQFAYQVEIKDDNVPNKLCEFTSADVTFKKNFGKTTPSVFLEKQGALQEAIDVITAIMTKHSKHI